MVIADAENADRFRLRSVIVFLRICSYAALALEMAAKESRADRKQELLEIAEVCEWVPEMPIRVRN